MPVEKTFSLQCRDILHHGGLAGEPEVILDLARARRKTLFALLALNKIKHGPLPFGQHDGIILQVVAPRKFK